MATRQHMFNLLGLSKVVDPLLQNAYRTREQEIYDNDLENSPHGMKWSLSLHASSFPGDFRVACGRRAVYGLMDIPDKEPISNALRQYAEMGQDIEKRIVDALDSYGVLLSAPSDCDKQTNFVDKEVWLTGSTDAAILPYKQNSPHIVEIKNRALNKVLEMKAGTLECDPKHEAQLRAYMAMSRDKPWPNFFVCGETWRISEASSLNGIDVCRVHGYSDCLVKVRLEKCISGSVYYVARDNPSVSHEFFFEHDQEYYDNGKKLLSSYIDDFRNGILPERPKDLEGKPISWGQNQCRYCPKKIQCRADYKEGVLELKDSNSIEYAKSIRPQYSYEKTREQVLSQWTE